MHAIRPAQINHSFERYVRIRKVADCFNEGLGFLRHKAKNSPRRLLSQVYYCPN